MIFFFKLGTIRAISLEINFDFGFAPIFRKTSYGSETVVDMPYVQVIYTPSILKREKDCEHVREESSKTAENSA